MRNAFWTSDRKRVLLTLRQLLENYPHYIYSIDQIRWSGGSLLVNIMDGDDRHNLAFLLDKDVYEYAMQLYSVVGNGAPDKPIAYVMSKEDVVRFEVGA